MSSMSSTPSESRTRPGVTPAARCSSSVSWEWVVEAGAAISKETNAPAPFGR